MKKLCFFKKKRRLYSKTERKSREIQKQTKSHYLTLWLTIIKIHVFLDLINKELKIYSCLRNIPKKASNKHINLIRSKIIITQLCYPHQQALQSSNS